MNTKREIVWRARATELLAAAARHEVGPYAEIDNCLRLQIAEIDA